MEINLDDVIKFREKFGLTESRGRSIKTDMDKNKINRLFQERSSTINAMNDYVSPKLRLSKSRLNEIYYNTVLAEMAFADTLYESVDNSDVTFEKSDPSDLNFELIEHFKKSLGKSDRAFTLTPYDTDELSQMKLFIAVRNGERQNAGFAFKIPDKGSRHNELVAVHKSPETEISGFTNLIMKYVRREGVNVLDHFDGFLSNLYGKFGFEVSDIWEWDDEYQPTGWVKSQESIDLSKNKKGKSIYKSLFDFENETVTIGNYEFVNFSFNAKKEQYANGEIDVVQRMRS